MPRKKSITVGDRHFTYQKDALEYYRDLLSRYNIGDTLSDRDFDEVYELLKNHPDASKKIGIGILSIFVAQDGYGGKCFHVKRTDNTTENFSFN